MQAIVLLVLLQEYIVITHLHFLHVLKTAHQDIMPVHSIVWHVIFNVQFDSNDRENLNKPNNHLARRTISNPILNRYFQLNDESEIKEYTKKQTSPLPCKLFRMMYSNKNRNKSNNNYYQVNENKYTSKFNHILNQLENLESIKLNKSAIKKESNSHNKNNNIILIENNNIPNYNNNIFEKSKFSHQNNCSNKVSSNEMRNCIILNSERNNTSSSNSNLNENNFIDFESYERIKKTNIIRELSEEESNKNSIVPTGQIGNLISEINMNLKIERERDKDSSISSGYSKDKLDNTSKNFHAYRMQIKKSSNNFDNKTLSSQNLLSLFDIDENINFVQKNDINLKTIKIINLKDLKINEKPYINTKNVSNNNLLEKDNFEKENLIHKEIRKTIPMNKKKRMRSCAILHKNINVKENETKMNEKYNIEISKIKEDGSIKRHKKNYNTSIVQKRYFRTFSKSSYNLNSNLDSSRLNNKIYLKKNKILLSPKNLIYTNKKSISNSRISLNNSNYSNSSSNFNSNLNSNRFSNSNRNRSTIRNIIWINESKMKQCFNKNDLKIINKNNEVFCKPNIRRISNSDNLLIDKNEIFHKENKTSKKIIKFSDKNEIFTISNSLTNSMFKDKDSLFGKSEDLKTINNKSFDKSKKASEENYINNTNFNIDNNYSNLINNDVSMKRLEEKDGSIKIDINKKFDHLTFDEIKEKIEDNENYISKKTLKEIRIQNKIINEEEKIKKKEFIENINLLNNPKLNYPYNIYDNNTDSNKIFSSGIGYKNNRDNKKENKSVNQSLTKFNNSDNIKLLQNVFFFYRKPY